MKIESGIPIPYTFPFADMKVGDSFVLEEGIKRTTLSVAAKRWGDKHGQKFMTRVMPDKTVRCWRTA